MLTHKIFLLLLVIFTISCKKDDKDTGPESETSTKTPKLTEGSKTGSIQIFPSDNAWNKDISAEPVDPNSDALIANIGSSENLHPDFGTV